MPNPIEPPTDALTFERGGATLALWPSEWEGKRQITVAQNHPQKTGGYWKGGITNMDEEVARAFADLVHDTFEK